MASNNDNALKLQINERSGIERSLKTFKRMCEQSGVVKEYRKRKDYKKPSVVKKEKTEAAVKRKAKDAAKARKFSKI